MTILLIVCNLTTKSFIEIENIIFFEIFPNDWRWFYFSCSFSFLINSRTVQGQGLKTVCIVFSCRAKKELFNKSTCVIYRWKVKIYWTKLLTAVTFRNFLLSYMYESKFIYVCKRKTFRICRESLFAGIFLFDLLYYHKRYWNLYSLCIIQFAQYSAVLQTMFKRILTIIIVIIIITSIITFHSVSAHTISITSLIM